MTRHFRPYFDAMVLSDIKPEHIVAFRASRGAKGLGKKTRRTIQSVLSAMCNNALEQDLIPKSPIRKKQAPKLDKHEKAALSKEQGRLLWDVLNAPNLIRQRAFYGVLLFTTIRGGESLGISWEDVDLAGRVIHIKREIYRGEVTSPKTKASLRDRSICDELYKALINQRAMAQFTAPRNYVFCSSSGRPMNPDQLRENLQAVLHKLGINHLWPREDGLHLLRHTGGSWVYESKGPKEAQRALGHASIKITMDTYVHLVEGSEAQTTQDVFTRPALPAVAPEQVN